MWAAEGNGNEAVQGLEKADSRLTRPASNSAAGDGSSVIAADLWAIGEPVGKLRSRLSPFCLEVKVFGCSDGPGAVKDGLQGSAERTRRTAHLTARTDLELCSGGKEVGGLTTRKLLGDHGIGAVNLSAIDTYAESLRDKLGL